MGSFLSHPGNKLVFQPPPKTEDELSKSTHTKLIDGALHPIPIIHCLAVDGEQNNKCMIHSHGNAQDLFSSGTMLNDLSQYLNIDVIGYDYTGYGYTQKLSAHTPSESNCTTCLARVVAYARELGYKDIILMGSSVGTGVTLSYIKNMGGFSGKVILESPFTSIFSVVSKTCQNSIVDMLVNIENIAHVETPAFILHGELDEVVPFNHGLELYEKHAKNLEKKGLTPYAPWWMTDAGHNDIVYTQGIQLYMSKLREYLAL